MLLYDLEFHLDEQDASRAMPGRLDRTKHVPICFVTTGGFRCVGGGRGRQLKAKGGRGKEKGFEWVQ